MRDFINKTFTMLRFTFTKLVKNEKCEFDVKKKV